MRREKGLPGIDNTLNQFKAMKRRAIVELNLNAFFPNAITAFAVTTYAVPL
jgi:hypothetical protein